MAAKPRFNLSSEFLLLQRSGTVFEKTCSLLLAGLGLVVLGLTGNGTWSHLTGFHQHWAGYACGLYLMVAPFWAFLTHSILMRRSQPQIEISDGWGLIRWLRSVPRSSYSSLAVVTHDRIGFKNKLSHSIILLGPPKPLFIYRAGDYKSAQDIARKFGAWMQIRVTESRGVNWTPSPWISRYNRAMLVILIILALYDWLS